MHLAPDVGSRAIFQRLRLRWRIERGSKNRHGLVVALDRTVSEYSQRPSVPDGFGDLGVHQDLPVSCIRAEAGREIDHTANGRVVEPVFVPDPSNSCRATGKTYPESDVVPSCSPADDELLHAPLHFHRQIDRP